MEKVLLTVSRWVHESPLWMKKLTSRFLAWLWWDVMKFRILVAHRNLRQAFPLLSRQERFALAKRSLVQLCGNFIDLLMVPAMDQDGLRKYVQWEGEEHLRQAFREKKGVLLLGLHMDSGDAAVACLALRGYSIHLITKRFKSPWMDRFWFSMRRKSGAHYIEAHGKQTAYDILKALKKNECVAFVNDQQMGPPYGMKTKFFGRHTGTAYGLALFALKTRAPIIPVYILRQPDWRQKMIIEPELRFSFAEEMDREAQIQAL
ncbi:MAG: lysophospholipid acyltransferase family protein, partial [Bdellovibrio sp.]